MRPPGHHAGRRGGALNECGQGFCLVNNVAIAATHLRLWCPWVTRVCVVDLDVHHGNGTEEIFQGDNETLCLSVHRSGDGFYPQTAYSKWSSSGESTHNIALNEGFGRKEFREAVHVFLERIQAFEPQIIFISAGFDAHLNDPLGGAKLTSDDFHWATRRLVEQAGRSCEGRIVSVLEGGYDVASLSECALSHLSALAGKEAPAVVKGPPALRDEADEDAFMDIEAPEPVVALPPPEDSTAWSMERAKLVRFFAGSRSLGVLSMMIQLRLYPPVRI